MPSGNRESVAEVHDDGGGGGRPVEGSNGRCLVEAGNISGRGSAEKISRVGRSHWGPAGYQPPAVSAGVGQRAQRASISRDARSAWASMYRTSRTECRAEWWRSSTGYRADDRGDVFDRRLVRKLCLLTSMATTRWSGRRQRSMVSNKVICRGNAHGRRLWPRRKNTGSATNPVRTPALKTAKSVKPMSTPSAYAAGRIANAYVVDRHALQNGERAKASK